MSLETFLHMDEDYMWRWYVHDATGTLHAMSEPFFNCEEAVKDLEMARRRFKMP